MKIATITFHWANNYGAVLQSFALQKFLIDNGYNTEVIDYVPIKVKLKEYLFNLRKINLNNLIKNFRLNAFMRKNIILSKNKYYTNCQLSKTNKYYDIFICGSDQIWNEWFIINSEKKSNLSYYLNFVENSKIRLSYATSFGVDQLSEQTKNLILPELLKFKSIFVREQTGIEIINNLGIDANLVVDPTLLLKSTVYENLIDKKNNFIKISFFSYILHQNQKEAQKVEKYIFNKYFKIVDQNLFNGKSIGINQWLFNIKNSELVLTNSFHGTIFAIIFNRPFIVMPVEGSKMNDRIVTLLKQLELIDRLIIKYDKNNINGLINTPINWANVESRLDCLRLYSSNLLLNILNYCKSKSS